MYYNCIIVLPTDPQVAQHQTVISVSENNLRSHANLIVTSDLITGGFCM